MKSTEFLPEASIFDERTLKNKAWKSPSQLIRWLKRNGFEKLATGHFAVVYAKPTHNRVVKVSLTQDDCWIKFAQWAMTQPNNKHLPKIPWIKRYSADPLDMDLSEEFFVTIVERLYQFNTRAIMAVKDPIALMGLYHFGNFTQQTTSMILSGIQRTWRGKDADDLYIRWLEVDQLMFADKFASHPFIRTLVGIENISGNCWNDLHDENLMVRKDGTIVITDPIAGSY